jgi:hypothetical protein
MGGTLKIYQMGSMGVNIDVDPISIEDLELRLAQNAIRDPLGNDSGLRKRPGLGIYNESLASGEVLGGIGVPVNNQSPNGLQFVYIGRGPF